MSVPNKKPYPEESAQELYDDAPCGYISFYGNGTIFNLNQTLLSWLGLKKEEVIEKMRIQDLFSIGGKIFFETHFFPLIQMQGFVNEIYFDILRADKSIFPGLINVKKVENAESYRATILNITDRKHYEEELLEARKKAEATSKSKARMLATVSHEIRTPLNAVHGISNLLKDTSLNAQQSKYVDILSVSSENLLKLVNNLLDLSKIESEKIKAERKSFLLSELIDTLQFTYEPRCEEKNVKLSLNIEDNVPDNLIGDPIKLNQVLTNLLGNAIKFTREGSVNLKVSLLEKGKNDVLLHFSVTDTGIGIPKNKLKRIFKEFSQASYETNSEYGGTGLGLNISQRLLKLLRSRLDVESEEGKGSNFNFELRFLESKEKLEKPEVLQRQAKEDQELLKSAEILIVEDSDVNIFILAEYFNKWNLSFESVNNGENAIERINKKQFDIVLMDLQMPVLSGYETARAIRKLGLKKQPAILALSASAKSDIKNRLISASIDGYIPKPFDPKFLYNEMLHHIQNFGNTKNDSEEIQSKHLPVNESEQDPKEIQSYDLSRFVKMANNRADYLKRFLKSTSNGFKEYKKDFETAVVTKNRPEIGKLIHKSTMSVYYTQADRLDFLIRKYDDLSIEQTTNEGYKSLEVAIVDEFQKIIDHLETVDEQKLVLKN